MLVIKKKDKIFLEREEALKWGLREITFSFSKVGQITDAGNCLTLANCEQLLTFQLDEEDPFNEIWSNIMAGKVREENEEAIKFITFLNKFRFLRLGKRYLAVLPKEKGTKTLLYEISLMIKYGLNRARMNRFNRTEIYKKANKKILKNLVLMVYQNTFSKKFKLFFPKKIGARLIAITSSTLSIEEVRVDRKTMELLNVNLGSFVLIARDPIITTLGWTMKIVGTSNDGTIECRPEIYTSICGDTDGDQILVCKILDKIKPEKYIQFFLDYYQVKVGESIDNRIKIKGITNKDILFEDKHKRLNGEISLNNIYKRMRAQRVNLELTKTATQRAGYWSIIMDQYIQENIEELAGRLNLSISETRVKYRILLFKIQQKLCDSKHSENKMDESLEYILTDVSLVPNKELIERIKNEMKFL